MFYCSARLVEYFCFLVGQRFFFHTRLLCFLGDLVGFRGHICGFFVQLILIFISFHKHHSLFLPLFTRPLSHFLLSVGKAIFFRVRQNLFFSGLVGRVIFSCSITPGFSRLVGRFNFFMLDNAWIFYLLTHLANLCTLCKLFPVFTCLYNRKFINT